MSKKLSASSSDEPRRASSGSTTGSTVGSAAGAGGATESSAVLDMTELSANEGGSMRDGSSRSDAGSRIDGGSVGSVENNVCN